MDISPVLILVALLAGALSVLTPCVLVMLPIILSVAGGEGRRRVVGVLIGLEISFIGISLLAGAAIEALGLPPRTQEIAAAVIILVLGVTMLVPALRHRLELFTSTAVSRMPGLTGRAAGGGDGTNNGFRSGLIGGLGLGLVWAPCAGPILTFVIATANTDGFGTRSVAMALAYGLGMLGPVLLVLRGGHAVVAKLRGKFGARRLDVVMGSTMLVAAALIGFGGLTNINQRISDIGITSTPIAGLERRALDEDAKERVADIREKNGTKAGDAPSAAELEESGYPESDSAELVDLGPAPGLNNPNATYNVPKGKKLDAAYLKGKVVVYDFWTYSCINCLRTLPYLKRLQDKYEKDGLVIVGVHTPEFAFEKDEGNVQQAIKDLDVTWPVATDPDFNTWEDFHNRFWPAKYIADRDGEIRHVHYGEGGYDTTEDVIRELLDMEPTAERAPAPTAIEAGNTPETYLGWQRLAPTQWKATPKGMDSPNVAEGVTDYTLIPGLTPTKLERDAFGVTGQWELEGERAISASATSNIVMHYRARSVYLVLGPTDASKGASAAARTVTIQDAATSGGGTRKLVVGEHKLYALRDGESTAEALMTITVPTGVAAYAFTFG